MHYFINCNSIAEKTKVILVLFSHGYTWRSGSTKVIPTDDTKGFNNYLSIFINKDDLSILQGTYADCKYFENYEKIFVKDILDENDNRIFHV